MPAGRKAGLVNYKATALGRHVRGLQVHAMALERSMGGLVWAKCGQVLGDLPTLLQLGQPSAYRWLDEAVCCRWIGR